MADHPPGAPAGSAVPLTGLVLCGGTSRRMGHDKALVAVDGEPLIDRVVRRLRQTCATVLLAVGDDPARLAGRGDAVVLDDPAGAGPLAGIAAGLAQSPTDAVAVCGVDHPHVHPALLAELAVLAAGHQAAVPVVDAVPQPLHAVWRQACEPALRDRLARGRRSVLGALDDLDWVAVGAAVWARHDPRARFALDVDTPADLGDADGSGSPVQ